MLKIGITGGIGSGKSTVCEIFKQLNIPVYSADDRAKRLMVENQELVHAIKNLFGEEAYDANGALNRSYIAERAFSDASLLEKLNQLVHPAVAKDFLNWAQEQSAPYVIKEAALMFESGSFRDLDYVVTVSAPKALRIRRTMQRDGSSKAQVEARMNKQWTEAMRKASADFIIRNDEEHAL
ncbi:MAG: dephospho-CoA kinase, partial [Bacteroidota bacterium]|nr:dephospho-CoA kinase [Bacteroidota bacterium]MDX5429851.1 dephospho-CoA kinase [Bacteroidota bacterium]MDX5468630.1 dephospho-CoA kinase [Bacteroidota bacterium]